MPLTYLQIGTWNIKHLGSQPTEDERSQSVFALTDHIEMAGIDLLALQEIYVTHTDDESRLRNEHLDQTCRLLKEHSEQEWDYLLLENRSSDDTSQLCGFLWNDTLIGHVQTLPVPVEHKVDGLWLWDRKPHAVKFATRAPILGHPRAFIAVPLHMKANGRDPDARKKRTLEAEQLARQVPWIVEELGDKSLVMLGDTNILGAWEAAVRAFEDAGLVDLNDEDAPTYAGGKAPFDRIFVMRNRPEFRYSRQYVLRSANETAHLGYLSDHYLVKTSIKIFVDPDDVGALR